jgi:hypothetical protein
MKSVFSKGSVSKSIREFSTLSAGGRYVAINTPNGKVLLRELPTPEAFDQTAKKIGYPDLLAKMPQDGDGHYLSVRDAEGEIAILERAERGGRLEATGVLTRAGAEAQGQSLLSTAKILADRVNDLRTVPSISYAP